MVDLVERERERESTFVVKVLSLCFSGEGRKESGKREIFVKKNSSRFSSAVKAYLNRRHSYACFAADTAHINLNLNKFE